MMDSIDRGGAPRPEIPLDETVALALRTLRFPASGLAAALAAVTVPLGADLTAAYLVPVEGPPELLAAGGSEPALAGVPGAVREETERMLRAVMHDARGGPLPEGSAPMPWTAFTAAASIATPLTEGMCVLVVAGEAPFASDALRSAAGPVALLAGLYESQRALAQGRRALSDLRHDRQLLAASLQHDLRSPVTSIIGAAQTMRTHADRLSHEDRERLLEIVASQARRMEEMIAETLDAAAAAEGPLRVLEVDLAEVARRAAGVTEIALGARVEVDVAELRLITDGRRVERALLNLLENAARYAPDGEPVHVIGDRTDEGAALIVADAGPGVAPGLVPTLFSPFATSRAGSGGTGLGLHSVASIAKELGGRVSYTRVAGWTRFTLQLPDLRSPTDGADAERETVG